jgi:hypothetical protein
VTIPTNGPTNDRNPMPEKPQHPPHGPSGATPPGPAVRVADQAQRYLTAIYGRDWRYKAPEQFPNLVEQWIWALAAYDTDLAEMVMTRLETMAAEAKS